jgi:hypothetical protein
MKLSLRPQETLIFNENLKTRTWTHLKAFVVRNYAPIYAIDEVWAFLNILIKSVRVVEKKVHSDKVHYYKIYNVHIRLFL